MIELDELLDAMSALIDTAEAYKEHFEPNSRDAVIDHASKTLAKYRLIDWGMKENDAELMESARKAGKEMAQLINDTAKQAQEEQAERELANRWPHETELGRRAEKAIADFRAGKTRPFPRGER